MKHATHPVSYPLGSTYRGLALALDRLPRKHETPIETARRAAAVLAKTSGFSTVEDFIQDLMPWHIYCKINDLEEVGEIGKAQALFAKEEALVLLPVARLAIDRENQR